MDDELIRTILHDEHLLLGAVMGEGACGRSVPLSYPAASSADPHAQEAMLCDLSGHGSMLMSGASAPSFVAAAFAGKLLAVGEVAYEAVLTGDGALVAIVLLARTGDAEYACWDLSGRGDALHAWLGFLSAIEEKGVRAFPDLSIEDASEALVPLLLRGDGATAVLADYLADQEPPVPGTIANLNLDAIGCLVATLPTRGERGYLVLVPPRYARVLWRSFLSFASVVPVGHHELLATFAALFPQLEDAFVKTDRVVATRGALLGSGLARPDMTFVGARGLT
ncbi:MAG: aminomethyltransferase family protein [Atopobiaceae bacterium]|nr:aminomethyltransferase family protein [Atopobiaceae bacterium]